MATMPGMAAPSTTAGPSAPVATDKVSIKNFAFAPAAITVKAGTTVTWTNADQDPHTVTSDRNRRPLNSTTLNTGDTYTLHLHHGRHVRLPVHDPPVHDRDGGGDAVTGDRDQHGMTRRQLLRHTRLVRCGRGAHGRRW